MVARPDVSSQNFPTFLGPPPQPAAPSPFVPVSLPAKMPPAAKSKGAAAAPNGGAPKAKAQKSAPSTNGTTTPVPEAAKDTAKDAQAAGAGKPDKAAYDAEQEQLKKSIGALQTKLVRGHRCSRASAAFSIHRLVCRAGQNLFRRQGRARGRPANAASRRV